MKRALIVGNMGYVGSVLSRHLRHYHPEAELVGFDSGLFAHCLTGSSELPETLLDQQHFGDIRDCDPSILRDVDAVICLAAISNDPMGSRFEAVTDAINHRATVELARLSAAAGVRNFVFASSCSIYGSVEGGARTEEHPVNPLTAYARSKVATEHALARLERNGMVVTSLRFATACGMSDRLRLDLVLNDFVACALASGEITVLSDGTPWRPLIHVTDMARAIDWAAARGAKNGGEVLVVNAGSNSWNFQVSELAAQVAAVLPGTRVNINKAAPPDKRSYTVDFTRFHDLAPDHASRFTLAGAISELRDGLVGMGFKDKDFRNSPLVRLRMLERHISTGRLDSDLRWIAKSALVEAAA